MLGNLNVQSLKNLEPEASVQAKSVGVIIRANFEFRYRFISFEFLFCRRGILYDSVACLLDETAP